jgi:enterochelin esterase family protein
MIENNKWNTAVNRLYYACFYAVIALLLKNDIETQSHNGARTKFSGAGRFSGAGLDIKNDYNGILADSAAFNKKVKLLWIGIGTNEGKNMYKAVNGFHLDLLKAGIKHVYYESPGTDHEWLTWRRDIYDFAPRLF